MTKRVLLYFALLLWFVVPVTAQPTIFVEDKTIDTETNITLDLKIADFVDIVSMQFSVNWETSHLQYDSLLINGDEVLPTYNASNVGTTNTHLGRITTSWVEPSLTGFSLVDTSTILTFYFTVLSGPGSSSDVSVTGDPLAIEISDASGAVLIPTVESGTVTVLNTDGIGDLLVQSNEAFTMYQNEPNPFDNQTKLRFEVYEATDFILEVYDSKGIIVHAHNAFYFEGNQSITITRNMLPDAGTYFYKLRTKDYFITNRMILVR